jgi:hypothetical protein
MHVRAGAAAAASRQPTHAAAVCTHTTPRHTTRAACTAVRARQATRAAHGGTKQGFIDHVLFTSYNPKALGITQEVRVRVRAWVGVCVALPCVLQADTLRPCSPSVLPLAPAPLPPPTHTCETQHHAQMLDASARDVLSRALAATGRSLDTFAAAGGGGAAGGKSGGGGAVAAAHKQFLAEYGRIAVRGVGRLMRMCGHTGAGQPCACQACDTHIRTHHAH